MLTLPELETALASYQLDGKQRDDRLGFRCCELALEALGNNCHGVGALLFDNTGRILAEGRNELFQNGFYSDRHAEMVVLNLFEERFPGYGNRGQLTIMVTLEPCPMCFTRLLLAGIGRLIYLAPDHDGGMAHRLAKMPAVWRNLARLQSQHQAEVTTTLSSLASQLANCHLDQLRHHLLQAIRGPGRTGRPE